MLSLKVVIDLIVGRKEPDASRITKVEQRVEDIDARLAILTARAQVKARVHR